MHKVRIYKENNECRLAMVFSGPCEGLVVLGGIGSYRPGVDIEVKTKLPVIPVFRTE